MMALEQGLPLDELWPSPDHLHQYFHPFLQYLPSSSSSLPPPPWPSNPQLPPPVATEKRGRSPKKKLEPKIGSASCKNKNSKNDSSSASNKKYHQACLSRAASERERRHALRDSIVALKELLPVRCQPAIPRQMDKCTVLEEAYKHILDLKEELQALSKKKKELILSSGTKAVAELRYNGSESTEAKEAKRSSIAEFCEEEDTVERSKRGAMFQEVVCNASNMFVTLQMLEGGGVRLSRVVGAIEKANVDIVNAVASWTGGDRSFCLLAHGKVQIEASSSSIQALKEELYTISISSYYGNKEHNDHNKY